LNEHRLLKKKVLLRFGYLQKIQEPTEEISAQTYLNFFGRLLMFFLKEPFSGLE
jgi:hypothetical protein